MRLAVDIIGFALIGFLLIGFVRGLTRLSRTDNAGEGPGPWSQGDGYGPG
jgi:hypothetical protein